MHRIYLAAKLLILLSFAIPTFVTAQLSPHEAISQMTKGINLGNTLEPPYEGEWGNPATQEYMFDMYKNEGFNCIRIPVRWDKHMGTASPFKISEAWFNRVEQILDWGLSKGLFIVVNAHHDDWIKDNYANPVNQARFDSLWSQVAVRFKDKSEKLIFEICNEPLTMSKAQNDEMHQKAIDVIRKTNPTRLVIFQGLDWGGSDGLLNAAIPNDPYLIGSFHSYDPWPFGLEGTGTFSSSDATALKAKFQKVKNWSVKNNIPVILGEFGGINKCEYNARMRQYKTYVELAETFGFTPCAWDDGGDFKIMNRSAQTWYDDLKDILVNSSLLSPKAPRVSIVKDTIVKLDWANGAADYDSIFIERRTGTSTFQRIDTIDGQATTFSDYQLTGNADYYYRVIGHYTYGNDLYSYPIKIFLPNAVVRDRKFYTGQALAIPGKVEAEDFDLGGEGFTFHDSDTKNITGAYRPTEGIDINDVGDGTFLVIDNYPGEWLEYSVNVAEKGIYNIIAPVAAFAAGGTFRVKIGTAESDIIVAPASASWIKTKPVSFNMNLEAGPQIMRLTFIDKPFLNIDYLEFIKNTPTSIDHSKLNGRFNVYQSKQELIVNTEISIPVEAIKIYNILGSLVKTIMNPGTSSSISTQDFPSGVYIVQLITEKQKLNKKIILQ